MIKQTLIAGAALALAAVPAFASHHSGGSFSLTSDSFNTTTNTWTITKAEVYNEADVSNMVYTAANTGMNTQTTLGSVAAGGSTSGKADDGSTSGDASNMTMAGDTTSGMWTGDAGAESTVTNVVNTTSISF